MTGHLLTLAHPAGIGTVTDRTAMTKILVSAMGSRKTAERPALDHARIAMAFGNARDINSIADFKKVGDFDFLADFIWGNVVEAKLPKHFEGALAGLSHMTLRGFVNPARLLAAEADLQRRVAVRGGLFLLHHHARAGLHNRNGNHIPLGVVELHHANFSADEPCHKQTDSKLERWSHGTSPNTPLHRAPILHSSH